MGSYSQPLYYQSNDPSFRKNGFLDGFSLSETLLAMFLSLFLIETMVSSLHILTGLFHKKPPIQQEDIAIVQVESLLQKAIFSHQEGSDTCFYYGLSQDFCLFIDKGRLVKKPGYEILFIDIEEGELILKEEYLIFNGKTKGKPFSYEISIFR